MYSLTAGMMNGCIMKRYKTIVLNLLLCSMLSGCITVSDVKTETGSTANVAAGASSSTLAYAPDELHKAAGQSDIEKVKEILSTKVDVDARDSFGGTALHAAMFQNDMQIVKLLIDYGFDVNAKGVSNGYTPLHDSVWADNLPAARLLIENGADLSIKNNEGQTPAEKAKAEGKQELYEYLSQMKQEK
jgi:ankyrin repeat protein